MFETASCNNIILGIKNKKTKVSYINKQYKAFISERRNEQKLEVWASVMSLWCIFYCLGQQTQFHFYIYFILVQRKCFVICKESKLVTVLIPCFGTSFNSQWTFVRRKWTYITGLRVYFRINVLDKISSIYILYRPEKNTVSKNKHCTVCYMLSNF